VQSKYVFTDQLPLSGLNYYRLKQVDQDDKYEYSPVVSLNFSRQAGIRITPNPASTYISLTADGSSAITVQIIDLNGRVLKTAGAQPGCPAYAHTVGGLAKGLYTVKAISSTGITTQKVLIQ